MKINTILRIGILLLIPIWNSCIPDKTISGSSSDASLTSRENSQAIEVLNSLFPNGDWEHEIADDILFTSWYSTDLPSDSHSHLSVHPPIIEVQEGVLYQISHHYNDQHVLVASSGEDFEIKWIWNYNFLTQVMIYNFKTGEELTIHRSDSF